MQMVQLFQWGSILLWALIIVLLLTVWKGNRHFLWSILAITLNFTLMWKTPATGRADT